MGRHHLSPRTHPSLRSTTANRRRAGWRGRFCSSRDKSTAASHPSNRTLGSGSTHLENRTVPCSRGLRFTVRQLCRISSSFGRSMLSPSDAGRRDGTLRAWAQSPQVQRHLRGDAGRGGSARGEGKEGLQAQCFSRAGPSYRFAGPEERMRTPGASGVPARAVAPCVPKLPGEPPFKAMVVPTPSGLERFVHSLRTRLRQGRPEAWEMSRLQSLTEIVVPLGLFHS